MSTIPNYDLPFIIPRRANSDSVSTTPTHSQLIISQTEPTTILIGTTKSEAASSVNFVIQPRNILNSELISLTLDPVQQTLKITMHDSPHEERLGQLILDADFCKEFQILESKPYSKPTTAAVNLFAELAREAKNGIHPYSNFISAREIELRFSRPFELRLPNSIVMSDFSIKNDNGILSINDSEGRTVEVINHRSCPPLKENSSTTKNHNSETAHQSYTRAIFEALKRRVGF